MCTPLSGVQSSRLRLQLPEHDGSVDGFEFPTSQICGDEARMDWIGDEARSRTVHLLRSS